MELVFEYPLMRKLECLDLKLDMKTAKHLHKNERFSQMKAFQVCSAPGLI